MAKNIYVGIGSKARKVKNIYVGYYSDTTRKVVKAYVGINNVARLIWNKDIIWSSFNYPDYPGNFMGIYGRTADWKYAISGNLSVSNYDTDQYILGAINTSLVPSTPSKRNSVRMSGYTSYPSDRGQYCPCIGSISSQFLTYNKYIYNYLTNNSLTYTTVNATCENYTQSGYKAFRDLAASSTSSKVFVCYFEYLSDMDYSSDTRKPGIQRPLKAYTYNTSGTITTLSSPYTSDIPSSFSMSVTETPSYALFCPSYTVSTQGWAFNNNSVKSNFSVYSNFWSGDGLPMKNKGFFSNEYALYNNGTSTALSHTPVMYNDSLVESHNYASLYGCWTPSVHYLYKSDEILIMTYQKDYTDKLYTINDNFVVSTKITKHPFSGRTDRNVAFDCMGFNSEYSIGCAERNGTIRYGCSSVGYGFKYAD